MWVGRDSRERIGMASVDNEHGYFKPVTRTHGFSLTHYPSSPINGYKILPIHVPV
ncbi:hypothetical protein Tco_0675539, partial [Tanacetum coccineum]